MNVIHFTVGLPEFGHEKECTFADFVEIVKGRSIVSAGVFDGQRLEFGLSAGAQLRLFIEGNVVANTVSTLDSDELPPLLFDLGDFPDRVPLGILEGKLRSLRTLHAITLLIETKRSKSLAIFLQAHPDRDIEESLLNDEEKLFVESVSFGSWVVALWSRTRTAFHALSSVSGMLFKRGREAYLSKLEADASIREHEAQLKAIEVAKAAFELNRDKLNYLLELAEKDGGIEVKQLLQTRITEVANNLLQPHDTITTSGLLPTKGNQVFSGLLPPPTIQSILTDVVPPPPKEVQPMLTDVVPPKQDQNEPRRLDMNKSKKKRRK